MHARQRLQGSLIDHQSQKQFQTFDNMPVIHFELFHIIQTSVELKYSRLAKARRNISLARSLLLGNIVGRSRSLWFSLAGLFHVKAMSHARQQLPPLLIICSMVKR